MQHLSPSFSQLRNLKSYYKEIIMRWPEGDGCCEVCLEKECFGNDELFQCELCEGIVHKRCYGGNLLNRGEKKDKTWFCERCHVLTREYLESEKLLGDKTKMARCHFCPDLKGVLKRIAVQLSAVQIWAHIGCVTAISTLSFIDSSFSMIVEISKPNRLSDQCNICNQKYGCCGFCHKEGCSFAFHFTCAKRRGLIQGREPTKMLFQATKCFSQQAASRIVYCPEHLFQLSILKLPQDKRIKGKFRKILGNSNFNLREEFIQGMNQQRCLYDQQGQSVSSLYSLDLRRQDDSHRKDLIKRFEQFARIRNMKEINISAAKKKMERAGKPSLIREKSANLTTEKLDQEQKEVTQELSEFESIENWKRVQRVMKNYDFRDLSKREKFISPIHLLEEIKENLECSVGENNQLDRDENPAIQIELNEENLQDSNKNQQSDVHQIKESDEIKDICDNSNHPPENIPDQEGTCDKEVNQDNTFNTSIQEKNVVSSEHCEIQISQETDQSEQKEEQQQSELHSKQEDSKETNIQSASQEVQIIITPNSSQNSSSISNSGTSFKVEISSQMNDKNSPNCENDQTNTIDLTLIEQKTSVTQLEHQTAIDHKQNQILPMQEEDKMEIEQQEHKTEQKLENNNLENAKKLKRIYNRFLMEYVSLNKENLNSSKSLYILHPAAMLVINIQEAFPLYTWKKEIAYYCVQQECLHPLLNEIQLSKSLNPQFAALWKNRKLPLFVPTSKFFEKFKKYFLVKIYDGKTQTIWGSDQAISCDQDA